MVPEGGKERVRGEKAKSKICYRKNRALYAIAAVAAADDLSTRCSSLFLPRPRPTDHDAIPRNTDLATTSSSSTLFVLFLPFLPLEGPSGVLAREVRRCEFDTRPCVSCGLAENGSQYVHNKIYTEMSILAARVLRPPPSLSLSLLRLHPPFLGRCRENANVYIRQGHVHVYIYVSIYIRTRSHVCCVYT